MCAADKGSKSGGGGDGDGGGDKKKKAKNPLDIIHKMVTPTKDSIAKNKAAGAKHTASQKAKGIGVARSNWTGSKGKRIKGVVNSETNPALVKLARKGKTGAAGLKELSRQQAATLGKDTSFKGIWKSLSTGEKHKPVESLLQFGKRQNRPNTGPPSQGFRDSGTSNRPNPSQGRPKAPALDYSQGGGKASDPVIASSTGAAGATGSARGLNNMLAINKNRKSGGKRKLKNTTQIQVAGGRNGSGLNIAT